MIRYEFNKSLLEGVQGLSCIENYLLYGMIENNYHYRPLYFNSYISFHKIIKEFLQNNAQYASFYLIPRLHQTASNNRLIETEYQSGKMSFPVLESRWDYHAITVKPKYMLDKYHTIMWRDDHYMLIRGGSEYGIYYLNDSPRDSGRMSEQEFQKIFAGDIFCYRLKRKIEEEDKVKFHKIFMESMQEDEEEQEFLQMLQAVEEITVARDILGILKVSRKRIFEYLKDIIGVKDMEQKYLNDLEQAYILLEYMRLRKRGDIQRLREIYQEIWSEDQRIIRGIKTKLNREGVESAYEM